MHQNFLAAHVGLKGWDLRQPGRDSEPREKGNCEQEVSDQRDVSELASSRRLPMPLAWVLPTIAAVS